MDVFPARNLPGEADKWGRQVESRLVGVQSSLETVKSSSENDSRFNSGWLAVTSEQVSEQIARSTVRTVAADLSVTGSATIEPYPRSVRSIPVTVPGGRISQVEIYVRHDNANYGNVAVNAYLSYNGSIVSKLFWEQDSNNVLPGASPQVGKGITNVVTDPSGVSTFSLTLIRVGFTSATTTETLTGIELFVTPSQRVL